MEKSPLYLLQKKIDNIMDIALKNHVFTAGSIGFWAKKGFARKGCIFNYGFAKGCGERIAVDDRTCFDLASLTKPLVVSLSLLTLLEKGKLHLEDKLSTFFNRVSVDKQNIKILDLLCHSGGLPAHRPYYKRLISIPSIERKKKLIEWILNERLLYEPGSECIYSDLGYILLGRIIEKVSGETLDRYWEKNISSSINLSNGLFFGNKIKKDVTTYVETGVCEWSGRDLYGIVNDNNSRVVGGVTGHAGLFGTTKALLTLCENLILGYRGEKEHLFYSSELFRMVLEGKRTPWIFGFDTPTKGLSSSGKYFSDKTIGHLGFTGTSFWIDLEQDIAIVVLTNRVLCGESLLAIKKLRPLLHDTIMEFLIQKTA